MCLTTDTESEIKALKLFESSSSAGLKQHISWAHNVSDVPDVSPCFLYVTQVSPEVHDSQGLAGDGELGRGEEWSQ